MLEYPILMILTPIIFAVLIYLIKHPFSTKLAFFSQSIMLLWVALNFKEFLPAGEIVVFVGGSDQMLNIGLKANELTYIYSILLIIIWTIIIFYSWPDRKNESYFYFFLLFLQGVFMGIVHTNDFFNLFIFIEIATIISAILIIYKKDGPSLRAGIYYLVFNTAGILLFLLGIIILYRFTGTLNMDIAKEILENEGSNNIVLLMFSLMVVSMGVKSAFFPVYNWLPRAHSVSTTSISAILSGVMVKSGVIGLYKILVVMPIENYGILLILLGIFTSISALIFGYSQFNIKKLLAFSTIAHIGFIVVGLASINLGMENIYKGALIHIMNHGILKVILFICTGLIVKEYKTYDINSIRGVYQRMPFVSIIMIFSILSIIGFPLFLAYQSKSIISNTLSEFKVLYIAYHFMNIFTFILFIKLANIFQKSYTEKKANINTFSKIALCLGLFTIIIMNIIEILYLDVILMDLSIWLYFIIYLLIGIFLERQLSYRAYIIPKIRSFELSFQAANYMMILFLFIMIFWNKIY